MNNKKVNQIIAEFDGYRRFEHDKVVLYIHEDRAIDISNPDLVIEEYWQNDHLMVDERDLNYTEDLNLMIPILEKLERKDSKYDTLRILPGQKTCDFVHWGFSFSSGQIIHHKQGKTVQESVALSVAEAILETQGSKNG